jgi:tRNA pseudouridine55 synthase
MVLIGKQFTRLSDRFLNQDKEYIATLRLGIRTDSYDCEGKILEVSDYVPTEEQIFAVLEQFQGNILQIPPMFSAKKINGKKLYELARKGISVEREAKPVNVSIRFLSFEYPYLCLHVRCSKGTYIRSLADDIGKALGTFAHLTELSRTRCGPYHIAECVDGSFLSSPSTYPPFKLLSYEATYDHCL